MGQGDKEKGAAEQDIGGVAAPSISLAKGGGAIRGIDEKFRVNPATGTASLILPIDTSSGRAGFGPQLGLTYDSGSGHGPFGFGWTLSLPRITRKTDKGLPRYRDAEESDVFILSGAEDLVPVRRGDGTRWRETRRVNGEEYCVYGYRPRIEGGFARIERWTRRQDGDVHWRSISKDNILTVYGKDARSRVTDPDDPRRIFSWLICETRDDRGIAVIYDYKPEDGAGVDLSRIYERNRGGRGDPRRTANRYIKRIRYGNREPLLGGAGERPFLLSAGSTDAVGWMFEVVFDYGEHAAAAPTPDEVRDWAFRQDPFSEYRAGFEVRTTRLCRRVLMFHHFPDEPGVGHDCLVHSTEFAYTDQDEAEPSAGPAYSFLRAATRVGYRRDGDGYVRRAMPPMAFDYSRIVVDDTVHDMPSDSLENLPVGLDDDEYHWIDLHGEGVPGILTEQGRAWLYKRNLGPLGARAKLAPAEVVDPKPNLALADGARLMDLVGDGAPDLVAFGGAVPGFAEHGRGEGWRAFRPLPAPLNRDQSDPNLRFVDIDGDGRPDVLITEDEALVWHTSLAEAGFGPAQRVAQALDEERGPRLAFADGTQSIYLADISGDGLADLVRVRNGDVCYWPNLGYGRFGAKVAMDRAPRFDNPDQFEQRRIRLADIDGTGTADIVYLHRDGVRLYFNRSGNEWSEPRVLRVFPSVDKLAAVTVIDLLGNGTACLVWSSPLASESGRQMRYVELMSAGKPYLLVGVRNNLGAETRVRYAPSTRFYLEDKRAGRPWITKLPIPVHVVERLDSFDHISRNRFVTRYAYHHGYFDAAEREFHGFGMVDQIDTVTFAALSDSDDFPVGDNVNAASHVPPVLTKTWFHTGAFLDRQHITRQFEHEYYGEPGLSDAEFRDCLLPDTQLPSGLNAAEEREACRTLKGSILRQEVFALDASEREPHPYSVSERDYTLRRLQPRGDNRHAVFFVHPRETIDFHYERRPTDPRIAHTMTLEVDAFGHVLKQASIGYGRRQPDPQLPHDDDRDRQTATRMTYSETRYTNSISDEQYYRAPLPCEVRRYELTGYAPSGPSGRFRAADFVQPESSDGSPLRHVFDSEIPYEARPTDGRQRRLIERARTLYRPDDLGTAEDDPLALLPLGVLEPLALAGERYRLAFTPGLLSAVFQRDGQALLADPASVLAVGDDGAGDRGGYADLEGDGHWWIPSGRVFFSPGTDDAADHELTHARAHFFLPHRFRDPFHSEAARTESRVRYDAYNLLVRETSDAIGNRTRAVNDYRVLEPRRVTEPNGNRTEVAFDALGKVVGTAIMGKPEASVGDSLEGFDPDLSEATVRAHLDDPLADPHAILGRATTRLVYDPFAYERSREHAHPQPSVVYTLVRETHASDLADGEQTPVRHSFAYADGFGREIQTKGQVDAGPVPKRNAEGRIVLGPDGRPEMTDSDVDTRWLASGWIVFNNKERPVREYEPFFTDTHRFEFDVRVGVSSISFYDPTERVVAILHPNRSWEKFVFDAWQQATWDVNDTAAADDPRDDPDVGDFFRRLPEAAYLPTWRALRTEPAHAEAFAARYPDSQLRRDETRTARKTELHTETPNLAYLDSLGRTFLTVAHNRFERDGAAVEELYPSRVELDIEGNEHAVSDAKGRVVMRYDYGMARPDGEDDAQAHRIREASMEAGERWMLTDARGHPIRAWDSRGHAFRREYDGLRRPVRSFVAGELDDNAEEEILTERWVYGEQHPEAEARNLRGERYLHLDQAGVVEQHAYDFKGNPLRASRRLAREYKQAVDWRAVDEALPEPSARIDRAALNAAFAPRLESGDAFTTLSEYDALDRPVSVTTPDGSVHRHQFNLAGQLQRVDVRLRGDDAATPFVAAIDYNAQGRRVRIEYGNGVVTRYEHDPLTFRLARLQTLRGAQRLQDLHYSYDPAGNVSHIRDEAQQTHFFDNSVVTPDADYTYDATYRLHEATGREHIGQQGEAAPASWNDAARVRLNHPHDGQAMRHYTQRFDYDAVGNLLQLEHRAREGNWVREYLYEEPGLLDSSEINNRLSRTRIGDRSERYAYDSHGNVMVMPHLPLMRWDHRDQLQATARQVVNGDGSPETTYYVYDAAGQRIRKVTECAASAGEVPAKKEERLYFGGFETFRAYENDGETVRRERETLHVMDEGQRIALVETRIVDRRGDDRAPARLVRFQFGNHLGSASLELDAEASIISYEEYAPYGSTSYQAVRRNTQTTKRYRYTGKERDEESGLSYHGARYYAVWLGRWASCDPAGLVDGANLYRYARGDPIGQLDTTGHQSEPAGEIRREAGAYYFYAEGRDEPSHIYHEGKWVRHAPSETIEMVGGPPRYEAVSPDEARDMLARWSDLTVDERYQLRFSYPELDELYTERYFHFMYLVEQEKHRAQVKAERERIWRGHLHTLGHLETVVGIGMQFHPLGRASMAIAGAGQVSEAMENAESPEERMEILADAWSPLSRVTGGRGSGSRAERTGARRNATETTEPDVYAISLVVWRRQALARGRGVTAADRRRARGIARRQGHSGPVDVGHSSATPHVLTRPGDTILLRAEPRGPNRAGGAHIRRIAEWGRRTGRFFVRPKQSR